MTIESRMTADQRIEAATKDIAVSMIRYGVSFRVPEQDEDGMLFLVVNEDLYQSHSQRVH